MVLDCLLAIRLLRILRERQEMMGDAVVKEGSGPGNKRELNAAFVVLVMAAVPLTIYIPNALCWVPYMFSALIANWNGELTVFLAVLGRITISVSIVVHLWNVYLYWYRVPGFRTELVRLVTCGRLLSKSSALSSTGAVSEH